MPVLQIKLFSKREHEARVREKSQEAYRWNKSSFLLTFRNEMGKHDRKMFKSCQLIMAVWFLIHDIFHGIYKIAQFWPI